MNWHTSGDETVVDLHIHTQASDGTVSPSGIVNAAEALGIRIIAITDHDTLDGNEEALDAAKGKDILVIPGLEISVNSKYGSVHILGLGIYHAEPPLVNLMEKIQAGRRERNPRIIDKLRQLGIDISLEEIREFIHGEIVGRPHIARALVRHGYAENQKDAFKRFLQPNAPAYVHRWRPTIPEAVTAITSSGGVPVVAHPGLVKIPDEHAAEFIATLRAQGVEGVEVNYRMHTRSQQEMFEALAGKNGMICTGGSDFHGENKPGAELGKGTEGKPIPFRYARDVLERLKFSIPELSCP